MVSSSKFSKFLAGRAVGSAGKTLTQSPPRVTVKSLVAFNRQGFDWPAFVWTSPLAHNKCVYSRIPKRQESKSKILDLAKLVFSTLSYSSPKVLSIRVSKSDWSVFDAYYVVSLYR